MELNKQRKVALSILGLALVALGVDHFVLGPPAAAEGGQGGEPPPVSLVASPSSGAPTVAPGDRSVSAQVSLAKRFSTVRSERLAVNPSLPRWPAPGAINAPLVCAVGHADAFLAPASWLAPSAEGAGADTLGAMALHVTSASSGRRTSAIVNGRLLLQGVPSHGMTLIEVNLLDKEGGSVVIEIDGVRHDVPIAPEVKARFGEFGADAPPQAGPT